jgi:hypothetical protein
MLEALETTEGNALTWVSAHPDSPLAIAWNNCLAAIEAVEPEWPEDDIPVTKSQVIDELTKILNYHYLGRSDIFIPFLEFISRQAKIFEVKDILFICRKANEFQDKIENVLFVSRLHLTPGSMTPGNFEYIFSIDDIFRKFINLTKGQMEEVAQILEDNEDETTTWPYYFSFYWSMRHFSADQWIAEIQKPDFFYILSHINSFCDDYEEDDMSGAYELLSRHVDTSEFFSGLLSEEAQDILDYFRPMTINLVEHLLALDPDFFQPQANAADKALVFTGIIVHLKINTEQLPQIFTLEPSKAMNVYEAMAMAIDQLPEDMRNEAFIARLIAIMAKTNTTEMIQALNALVAELLGGTYTRITDQFLNPRTLEAPVARREIRRGPALDDKQITHTQSVHQSTKESIWDLLRHYCPAAVSETDTGGPRVSEAKVVAILKEQQKTLADTAEQVRSGIVQNMHGRATLSSLFRLLGTADKAGECISIRTFIAIALLALMDETQYREGVTKAAALAAFREALLDIATEYPREYQTVVDNPRPESLEVNTVYLRIEGGNVLYKVRDPFKPETIHEGSISLETLGCPVRSLSTPEDRIAFDPYLEEVKRHLELQGRLYPRSTMCISGSFNKVVEKLYPIHKLFVMRVITRGQAADSLPSVAKQEMWRALERMDSAARTDMIHRLKEAGTLDPIWRLILDSVTDRLWGEYHSLYHSKNNREFVDLLAAGIYVAIDPTAFDRPTRVTRRYNRVYNILLPFLLGQFERRPTPSASKPILIPEGTTVKDFGGGGNCLFLALAGQLAESDVGAVAANLRELVVGALTENIETLREWVEAARSDVHLRFAGGNEKIASASRYLELIAQPGTWGGEIEIGHLAVILGRPIAVYGAGYQRLYPSNVTEEGTATYEGELLMLQYTGNHYQALTATPERAEQILAELVVEFAQSTPIGGAGGPSGGAGGPAGGAGGSSASAVTAFYPQPDETLRQQAGRNHQGKSGTKQSDSASDSDEEKPRENKKRRADTPEPS